MITTLAAVSLLSASAMGQVSPTTLSPFECGGRPVAPSPTWRWVKGASPIPGFVRQQFYLNIGVFGPATAMNCACGFAYSGAPISGLNGVGVDTVILDTSTQQVVGTLPGLTGNLLPSTVVTNSLNAVQPGPAGLNWLGFGGLVNPFNAPILPPNQQFQFCFRIDVPIAVDIALKQRLGWVGGGIADSMGVPIYDPGTFHHFEAFAPDNPDLSVPTPGAAAALAFGGALMVARRRRQD